MGGTCHRMENHFMPRQPLYGVLEAGKREQGCPRKRYKDTVNGDLRWCDIKPPPKIENAASDRNHWHSWTHTHSTSLEDDCRQRRMAAYELSHKTTSADITTIPVPHLFQTLRFQSRFLEPLENLLRSHNTQSS